MTLDVHATQESLSGTNGFGNWRMLGAPSTNESIASLLSGMWTQGAANGSSTNGAVNVYTWDEVSGSFVGVSDFANAISNGKGLIAYVYEDDVYGGELDGGWPKTIAHSGTNKTGNVTYPITYTINGSGAEGFNMVANPYPFAIDWDAIEGWTKTNMSNSIYVWNANANGGFGGYEVWNGTTGTRTNGKIAPYQAFWVEALNNEAVLSSTEKVGLPVKETLQKQGDEPESYLIEVMIQNGDFTDKALYLFDDRAEEQLDPMDAL